jgi:sugar O-acyltransferase (sialic acid O-acetyltransferase NeuD family)
MSCHEILTPHLGTNDTEARLVTWLREPGARVKAGVPLCELETTKATIEVEAPTDGFLSRVANEGDLLGVGDLLGLLTEAKDFDVASWQARRAAEKTTPTEPTRKAQILMNRHGIRPEELPAPIGGVRLSEADVSAFLKVRTTGNARLGLMQPTQRIAIIGGVGGGGALIIVDAARRMDNVIPVAIYDQDPQFHGRSVLGVPVRGPMDEFLKADRDAGMFDALIIAFNRNLGERDRVFHELCDAGYNFANIIDPNAEVRAEVEIGTGNVILSRVYIGACSRIGSNNFISANVALEHGNVLGDSCAFGPGVFTSGNVSIGNRVRFGTGIFVEPGLDIGDDAVIGSGQTLVTSLASGKLLTSRSKG